eukprot:5322968-Alexandrium_andersonii.AAC.1
MLRATCQQDWKHAHTHTQESKHPSTAGHKHTGRHVHTTCLPCFETWAHAQLIGLGWAGTARAGWHCARTGWHLAGTAGTG